MNALLLALALSSSTVSTPAPVVKPTVTKSATKWTCGAPRALENDSVQTVRICEFK